MATPSARGPTLLPADGSGDALEVALANAMGVALDPGAACDPQDLPGAIRPDALIVFLSTRMALDPGVAFGLARWAANHHRLTISVDLLATLAREAAVNAAVHGNLGLPGLGGYGGDFGAYMDAIGAALSDPKRASLPVLFAWRPCGRLLTLHVQDCGDGFSDQPLPSTVPTASGPTAFGNGLRLIRSIADRARHSQGGRRLSMGFRRND